MPPAFLLDEHISPRVAKECRNRGLDVLAIAGSPMAGIDDLAVFRLAVRQRRILVTYNAQDFVSILVEHARSGETAPGVVFVDRATISTADIGGLVRALRRLAALIADGKANASGGIFLSSAPAPPRPDPGSAASRDTSR